MTYFTPPTTESRERALLFLGGMRAADRIASALSAQVMANLIAFEKEKMHEQMGYKRFAEFLDRSPYSPMTKHQFYKRREIFDREGEQVFDLMNEIGLPLARRKLLGRGAVRVEGETVIVNDGDGEMRSRSSSATAPGSSRRSPPWPTPTRKRPAGSNEGRRITSGSSERWTPVWTLPGDTA